MRKLFTIIIALFTLCAFAQNYYTLRGYVYNEENQPLSSVHVRTQQTNLGTVTNSKGQYELILLEGLNRVVFSFVGFESQSLDIVMEGDKVQNIWLKEEANVIQGVDITNKRKDYSYEIMRNVIEAKDKYQNQYSSLKHQVYVKSVEEIKSNKEKTEKAEVEEELDKALEATINDSIANLNLYEANLTIHFEAPNKFKEEKTAAKKWSSQSTLFYTSTTDGDFNFYDNLLLVKKISDNSFVSPLSNTAFISYKFKLLGSYYEGNQKIYKIKVIPRKLGNALVKGEIEVYDSIWALKKIDVEFPKNALILYSQFSIVQEYAFVNSKHVIVDQQFNWEFKNGANTNYGSCMADHHSFVFDTIYNKKFFNAELGRTLDDAYDKDTSYWNKIRPKPLTKKEQDFVRYKDSLDMIYNSKEYLDSIDSVYNKITVLKLLWYGQGHIIRSKKTLWNFDPAVNILDPLAIGGWRFRYSVSYYKKFENRKSMRISPFLNYGLRNQDFKGSLFFGYLYNPKKLSIINLRGGRYFDFVNSSATIADIIKRSNFYEETFLNIYHSTELFNGFYLHNSVNYAFRQDLTDFSFAPIGDSLFENNLPVAFKDNISVDYSIGLSYRPKQLYLSEPNEKIVLGSKFPTFSLYFQHSVPGVLGSSNKFNYAEFSVKQEFNIGVIGTSEYRIQVGKFLDTSKMQITDYKYMRGGDPYWFTPAMYTFQLIEETFPTFDWYLESHYVHQFNGFLTGRVPGFKKLGIKTMGGAGFLYAPEKNYQYSEIYFGLNRIFKIGRERFRLGAYYVLAQSNDFGIRNGLKFSFEIYNPDKNTWSF